jgi:hypothetical protein
VIPAKQLFCRNVHSLSIVYRREWAARVESAEILRVVKNILSRNVNNKIKKRNTKMKTTGIKRWVGAIIAFSIMLYGAATSVEKPNALDLRATSNTFSAVAKEAIPAVVFIKVEKVIEAGSVFGPESPLGGSVHLTV